MKLLLIVLVGMSAVAVHAESPCDVKMKNAAQVELANTLGVSVDKISVVRFDPGGWTEAMANNYGYGYVAVKGSSKKSKRFVIQTYKVDARQIGSTDDCDIQGVEIAQAL